MGDQWAKSFWVVVTNILCLSFLAPLTPVSAGQFTVFEKTYVRGTGTPQTITDDFSVLNSATTWHLQSINGNLEDDTIEKVSSSSLTLNGTEILQANQFSQNTSLIDVDIDHLLSVNSVSTLLKSKPGGQMIIKIFGDDSEAPSVFWTAPSNGAFLNTSIVSAQVQLSDTISGLNPASLLIRLNGGLTITDEFSPILNAPALNSTLSSTLQIPEGTHP